MGVALEEEEEASSDEGIFQFSYFKLGFSLYSAIPFVIHLI
jgi:hypothetical protein